MGSPDGSQFLEAPITPQTHKYLLIPSYHLEVSKSLKDGKKFPDILDHWTSSPSVKDYKEIVLFTYTIVESDALLNYGISIISSLLASHGVIILTYGL